MKKHFILILILALCTAVKASSKQVTTLDMEKQLSIQSMSQSLIEDTGAPDSAPPLMLGEPSRSALDSEPTSPLSLSEIINVGSDLWKLIKDNAPVTQFSTSVAHAMPSGINDPFELQNWKGPRSASYQVVYKNTYGVEAAKFVYRIHYMYAGSSQGSGRYLANVTVTPEQISTSWGWTLNADVSAMKPTNMGTSSDPMAAMQLNIHWKVTTALNSDEGTSSFLIRGDGWMVDLNRSNSE
jgi:hypothetical protein